MATPVALFDPRPGVDVLAIPGQNNALYQVGFAVSERAIDAALRLRFDVFNVELGEGLMTSRATGMDRDVFDAQMVHLVLLERATGRVVGTYRMQTATHGRAHAGIYSEQEYDLAAFDAHLPQAVECGRACISEPHRSMAAVILLWKGIGAYLQATDSRWLFGCCSITTLDPMDGWRAMRVLRKHSYLHDELSLPATRPFSCGARTLETDPALRGSVRLPKLFSAYMRLGAKVVSEPAIDREFGTVDFLVLLDSHRVKLSSLTPASLLAQLIRGPRD